MMRLNFNYSILYLSCHKYYYLLCTEMCSSIVVEISWRRGILQRSRLIKSSTRHIDIMQHAFCIVDAVTQHHYNST